MRKFLAALAVAACVVALAAPAFAATETVKGQIVDQMCYMKDSGYGRLRGSLRQEGRADGAAHF